MAVSGKKDDDDSQKRSLEKRQENGLGQPGVAGRPKMDASALWEERARERMTALIDSSLDAVERAVNSPNTKLASDVALKLMRQTWVQDQKITVENTGNPQTNNYLVINQNPLNDKELHAMNLLQGILKEGASENDEDVIDVEAHEDKNN